VDAFCKPFIDRMFSKDMALEDQTQGSMFISPPMLKAPPKDKDEIIDKMIMGTVINAQPDPSNLSTEELEKRELENKARKAKEEAIGRFHAEMKVSFERIGLEYKGWPGEIPDSLLYPDRKPKAIDSEASKPLEQTDETVANVAGDEQIRSEYSENHDLAEAEAQRRFLARFDRAWRRSEGEDVEDDDDDIPSTLPFNDLQEQAVDNTPANSASNQNSDPEEDDDGPILPNKLKRDERLRRNGLK